MPALLLCQLVATSALAAPPLTRACQAPPLPPPSDPVVSVATVAQLQAAVAGLQSGTTVLVQPGTYHLTSTLWVNSNVDNVAIRGSTDSPAGTST